VMNSPTSANTNRRSMAVNRSAPLRESIDNNSTANNYNSTQSRVPFAADEAPTRSVAEALATTVKAFEEGAMDNRAFESNVRGKFTSPPS
jgi:hypothetical protein